MHVQKGNPVLLTFPTFLDQKCVTSCYLFKICEHDNGDQRLHANASRERRTGRRRRLRVLRTVPSRPTKDRLRDRRGLRRRGLPRDPRGSHRRSGRQGRQLSPRASSICRKGGQACLRRIGVRLLNLAMNMKSWRCANFGCVITEFLKYHQPCRPRLPLEATPLPPPPPQRRPPPPPPQRRPPPPPQFQGPNSML